MVEAKSSDVEVTYQIMCNSLKPYLVKLWDWDEAHQQKIHRKKFKASKTHLIKFQEEIIGYMVVSEKDKEIYLEHLLVDDQFQNLGIGTEVMHR